MSETTTALRAAATGQAVEVPDNPNAFSKFLERFKPQLELVLPKHLNADRMCRLAVSQFSASEQLRKSDPMSIVASIMTASTLGLEIGVNGQAYLIPYFDKGRGRYVCQLVPGWKGLVDIANRSGNCSAWTGAVHKGDAFDFELGDKPRVQHKPGDAYGDDSLTHVYAVGRVRDSEWPVIEVWSLAKVFAHRDRFNKVGDRHYSYQHAEMYARKIALLQVLKYMPQSIELSNAVRVSEADDRGARAVFNAGNLEILEPDDGTPPAPPAPPAPNPPPASAAPPPPGKSKRGSKSTPPAVAPAVDETVASVAPTPELVAELVQGITHAKDRDAADLLVDTSRNWPDAERKRVADVYRIKWST